jgi:FAD-linked oxidoreductase
MTGWSRRGFLNAGAVAAGMGMVQTALPASAAPTPWHNWSGALSAAPAGRIVPGDEEELAKFLATSSGALRPVGSGHSFAPLVPTDGHLVVIDQLTGLLEHDPEAMTATFAAGTRLGDMGAPLQQIGQAMLNLPDIDRQSLAGAIATATHGTGLDFTSLSGMVTGLRLITPAGEILDLSAQTQPDLFNAARVSLGALGIITRVSLQNRTPYRLKARSWVQPIEEVLENFDAMAAEHRHFEMFPLVHCDYAQVLSIDEIDEPINNPPPSPEEADSFAQMLSLVSATPVMLRRPLLNTIAGQIEPSEVVDVSYRILSNIRNDRFNEMEYSVPLEAGAECLREILHTIAAEEVDVVFPLEYRYVKRDDTWLGMSCGDEDHASISIHRTAGEDYRPYFDLMEPIFWKYGGRPHWGKVHSLGARQLTDLYPRFADFQELRAQLDPDGRMLNEHLRKLFLTDSAGS